MVSFEDYLLSYWKWITSNVENSADNACRFPTRPITGKAKRSPRQHRGENHRASQEFILSLRYRVNIRLPSKWEIQGMVINT